MTSHQRTTSVDEDLIIRWTSCPALWTSIRLFPQPPHLGPMGSWTSGHGVRDGGYAWTQQHGLLLTKADLFAVTPKCPTWAQLWASDLAPFPRRMRQPPGGRLIALDSIHLGRGTCSQAFCQNHHLCTYIIGFPSWYSHGIAPKQETRLIAV